jgi:hypothetical protein
MNQWPLMEQLPGLESEPCSGSWKLLKAFDGVDLDRKIHAAGWNFFFLATEVKVMFFGALGAKKISNALHRILWESEGAGFQLSRSDRDRRQALSWRALCHRFGTLASSATDLLLG